MIDSLKEYFTSEEWNLIQSITNNDSERNESDILLLLSIGRKVQELLQSNKLS